MMLYEVSSSAHRSDPDGPHPTCQHLEPVIFLSYIQSHENLHNDTCDTCDTCVINPCDELCHNLCAFDNASDFPRSLPILGLFRVRGVREGWVRGGR